MKELVILNKNCKTDYMKQFYKFMTRDNIYKSVMSIL